MLKRIRWWLRRRWKRFLYAKCHYRYCPCCRKFVKIGWVQEWIYHPEEPPMFIYWECTNCKARTPTMPTFLTTDAVRSLGYKDFDEYCRKVLKR